MRRRRLAPALAALALLAAIAWSVGPVRSFLGRTTCGLDAPDAGRRVNVTLRRVVALGDDAALAVGSRYAAAVGLPVAFRWDGSRWDETSVPVASEIVTSGLHDVATAGGDAWAVGSTQATTPFAVAWDGEAWSRVATVGIDAERAEWLGVAASDAGTWAVGKRTSEATDRAIVGRLDGVVFLASDLAAVGARGDVLADVAVAGDVGWAVGWSVDEGGARRPLAARLEEGAWTVVPTPDAGDAVLASVAVVGPDEAWAVGWTLDAEGDPSPLVLHAQGAEWSLVAGPRAAGRLLAVAARGPALLVAGEATDGDGRPEGFLASLVDGEWEDLDLPEATDRWLTSLDLAPDGAFVGVGDAIGEDERYGSFLVTGCAP